MKSIIYYFGPLVVLSLLAGCTASSHPPSLPADSYAKEVPYLWPESEKASSVAASPKAAPEQAQVNFGVDNGILAIVNKRIITLLEVDQNIYMAIRNNINFDDENKFYEDLLDNKIEKLLLLELAEQMEIEIAKQEVDQRLEELIKSQGGYDTFRKILDEQKMTIEKIRQQIRDDVIVFKVQQKIFTGLVSPAPEAVHKEYKKRLALYSTPERRDISLILIMKSTYDGDVSKTKQIAQKTYKLLETKAFAEVAKTHSEGPKASDGGRWGYVQRKGDLADEISKVAYKLLDGEVSKLIETQGFFFIVKCNDIQQASVVPFEKVQAKISREILTESRIKRKAQALRSIRDSAFILRVPAKDFWDYKRNTP